MLRPLALAALALVTSLAAADVLPRDGGPNTVVRVLPQDLRQLRVALAVSDDLWSHGAAIGAPVDLRVDEAGIRALAAAGMRPSILIADVAALIDAEAARIAARRAGEEGGVAGGDLWFDDFRTLAEIDAKLDAWVAARPDVASIVEVGTSLEGRTIRGIRISAAGKDAPTILINGCQHAREWISPMTVMFLADRLLEAPQPNPFLVELLGSVEIIVVPVVNPDGYQFSWDEVRLWRKNRRNNGDGTFGVDLNRNWDFGWGGAGSSGNPSSETYRGPAPFSEPESQALRDLYLSRPKVLASIDYHSYSQLILSPWGYTSIPSPDAMLLDEIGSDMVDAIASTSGVPYVSGPIGPTLYIASGNVVDWAYGVRDALAYTIELRDTGEFGFILPADQILPTCEENWAAFVGFLAATTAPAAISFSPPPPSVLEAGAETSFEIDVRPLAGEILADEALLLHRASPGDSFAASPLVAVGPRTWLATLPAEECGATVEYYVEIGTTAGAVRSPANAPTATFVAEVFETSRPFGDDFEKDLGWIVGGPQDDATSGQWVRVSPIGTIAQPAGDSSSDGTLCYVTGQGPLGGADGAADVDNGQTTLTSPILDASHPDSVLSYDRWYSNNLGSSPNQDSMPIEISNDGGATWTLLELVTENAGAWVTRSFRVADFVEPSASVRVRFIARDLGAGSLVEAGVDEVTITVATCSPPLGDLDGDGVVGPADLAILLGAWGTKDRVADLDGDGTVGASDLAILLGAWG